MRISSILESTKSSHLSLLSNLAIKSSVSSGRIPIVAAAVSAFVYWRTIFSDLTWLNFGSDGAELIAASVTLGVPHPPGYPTYILLGKLFSLLPVGPTIAYRFNLFSAVSMVIAVGFITAAIIRLHTHLAVGSAAKNRTALIIGLSFAFIPLVWSQAIIAEVYALNLCFIAITLWLLIRPAEKIRPLLIGISLGLAVTTHLTSLLLIPLVLTQLPYKNYAKFALGFVVGILPLFALPLLSFSGSPVIWGNPASLEGWWWLVSAKLYHPYLDFPGLFRNLTPIIKIASITFAIALLILILIGLTKYRAIIVNLFKIPLDSAIALSAGSYFIFAALYNTNDAILLILPAFLLLALLLSKLGIRAGPGLIILPLVLVAVNLAMFQPDEQLVPRSVGEETLRESPEGAILITDGERSTFTLWYLQSVEGRRRDLIIVDKDLLQFEWYRNRLVSNYPSLLGLDSDDLELFTSKNSLNHEVCFVNLEKSRQLICS